MEFNYISERLDPRRVRENMSLIQDVSLLERQRLKKCRDYFENINHTYLKLDDVKNVDGSKLFLAVIDYEDSILFRQSKHFKETLFPYPTILGNIDGIIYDFTQYLYLDLDKYRINYARSFSSIVVNDYWHFDYDGSKVNIKTNTVYSDSKNVNGRRMIIMDKFHLIGLNMGLECNVLYDEDALSKVLLKRKEG